MNEAESKRRRKNVSAALFSLLLYSSIYRRFRFRVGARGGASLDAGIVRPVPPRLARSLDAGRRKRLLFRVCLCVALVTAPVTLLGASLRVKTEISRWVWLRSIFFARIN